MTPFLFAIGSFCLTLLGGLFGIRFRDKMHLIISFTAGVLLAIVFFDIIPEIFDIASSNGFDVLPALIAILCGFLVIHILEKAVLIHSAHEDEYSEHRHPFVGYVGAGGITFHSFLDGVGIGLGFHVSPEVGAIVGIAVIAHNFSDGLNAVSLMLMNKNTVKKALAPLVLLSVAPMLGLLATYLVTIPDKFLMIYLGIFAGFLIYISASDLLPEAHSKKSSWSLIGLTALGMIFVFVVTRVLV